MGGLRTGCTEETVNVFVEAAYFDPVRTARTGRRLKINSDARYRFERGVDPAFTVPGIELATRMILDLCGGEPSEVEVAGAVPQTARELPPRPDPRRPPRRHGDRAGGAGAHPRPPSASRRASPRPTAPAPSACRAGGPTSTARPISSRRSPASPRCRSSRASRSPARPGVARPILTPMQRREGQARRRIAALGYNECVTYSFIDRAAAALFGGGARGGAAREPDQLRDEPHAARPAARPAARGGAQPGPRLPGPRALRGRPGLPRRRARRAGAARRRAADRRERGARPLRDAAARSTSTTRAPTPRRRSPPSGRRRR